jgi:hypothetical protein
VEDGHDQQRLDQARRLGPHALRLQRFVGPGRGH